MRRPAVPRIRAARRAADRAADRRPARCPPRRGRHRCSTSTAARSGGLGRGPGYHLGPVRLPPDAGRRPASTSAGPAARTPSAVRSWARSPLDDYEPVEQVAECRRDLEARADLAVLDGERGRRSGPCSGRARPRPHRPWALSTVPRLRGVPEAVQAHVRSAVLMGFAPLDYKRPSSTPSRLNVCWTSCWTAASSTPPAGPLSRFARGAGAASSLVSRKRTGRGSRLRTARCRRSRRGPFGGNRTLLSTAAGQSRLPNAIIAPRGRFRALPRHARQRPSGRRGLYLTIACSEGGARIAGRGRRPPHRGNLPRRLPRDAQTRRLRRLAHLSRAGVVPRAPASATPILVFTGSMDHVTPPDWAQAFCTTAVLPPRPGAVPRPRALRPRRDGPTASAWTTSCLVSTSIRDRQAECSARDEAAAGSLTRRTR